MYIMRNQGYVRREPGPAPRLALIPGASSTATASWRITCRRQRLSRRRMPAAADAAGPAATASCCAGLRLRPTTATAGVHPPPPRFRPIRTRTACPASSGRTTGHGRHSGPGIPARSGTSSHGWPRRPGGPPGRLPAAWRTRARTGSGGGGGSAPRRAGAVAPRRFAVLHELREDLGQRPGLRQDVEDPAPFEDRGDHALVERR